MRISHRVDYGLRVMVTLAARAGTPARAVPRRMLGDVSDMPDSYLVAVLSDLRKRQLARSVRGSSGGWLLARPASTITVADVVRALDGPLTSVRGYELRDLDAPAEGERMIELWSTLDRAVRDVLEGVTIADLAAAADRSRTHAIAG